jgi:hypothetical protein
MAHTEINGSPLPPTMSRSVRERVELERERIAENHAHDSSSVAPSRAAQPTVLLRSPTMWGLLFLPTLTVIAVLSYMMLNLRSGPGRVPGAGDRASPNAQPGDN